MGVNRADLRQQTNIATGRNISVRKYMLPPSCLSGTHPVDDPALPSRWAAFRTRSQTLRASQAAPKSGMAGQVAGSASKIPDASETAEGGNADRQPHALAATPAKPTPADAASPELAQVILARAAQLARQPGFQANATHLKLAYRVHGILVAARQGGLAISRGVDRNAVQTAEGGALLRSRIGRVSPQGYAPWLQEHEAARLRPIGGRGIKVCPRQADSLFFSSALEMLRALRTRAG